MALDAYRGDVIRPAKDGTFQNPKFDVTSDCVTVVGDDGTIELSRPLEEVSRWESDRLSKHSLSIGEDGRAFFSPSSPYSGRPLAEGRELFYNGLTIGPVGANIHDHLLQPPGVPGPLMRQDGSGWLRDTLVEGELPAKYDLDRARAMIRERLTLMVKAGVGRLFGWPTSSEGTARIVLEEAKRLGVNAQTGIVLMDRMDQEKLNVTIDEARSAYESLLSDFPGQVAMIHRFGIACQEEITAWAVDFARRHGLQFHTHFDESTNEQDFHACLHDGESIFETYQRQGILGEGMNVVLAHAIHTDPEHIRWIGERSDLRVAIAACPSSNAHLGSHASKDGYVGFPYQKWQEAGVPIALATDAGAGRLTSVFQEAMNERGRQMGFYCDGEFPSEQMLWAAGVQGSLVMGDSLESIAIKEGQLADFAVVELSGSNGTYAPGAHRGDPSRQIFRYVEGAATSPERIPAIWVKGRPVKIDGRLNS